MKRTYIHPLAAVTAVGINQILAASRETVPVDPGEDGDQSMAESDESGNLWDDDDD